MLAPPRVVDYLARLDHTLGEASCDAAGLARLHEAHLRRVPFENLSIHLGEPIQLDEDWIVTKLVDRRRGGFCFEMNGGFAALLEALGFDVTLHEGRVYKADGTPGIHFDHLCLSVDLGPRAGRYLVDVGFGASFGLPLRLGPADVQVDPLGQFQIVPTPGEDGWFDLVRDGKAQFRFSLEPHELADFAPGCEYHQTSPDSNFTQNSLCSMPTADGRVTVAGRLLVERRGDERTERTVDDDAELLALYRDRFGITLDRVPPR
jgi:N-hydroxyarylamine O-acetyltransferase